MTRERRIQKCAALGCEELADPRMYLHGPYGALMACDGHGMGGVCKAPTEECTCPPTKPREDWRDDPDLNAVKWNGHIVLLHRLAKLAANLSRAGQLTEAWILGAHCGAAWSDDIDKNQTWAPNARGEAAPGFGGEG